jgi:hypothetical protein
MRCKSQVFVCSACFAVLAVWPLVTIRESLWIDELHTAWVVDGEWSEVQNRAAIGNQSPLFFYVEKATVVFFGSIHELIGADFPPELQLRFFPWLGWLVFIAGLFRIASIGRPLTPDPSLIRMGEGKEWWNAFTRWPDARIVLVPTAWLLLDRIGIFYAIEARPYIWVAACSAWLLRAPCDTRFSIRWLVVAAMAFYLHYTALLLVFWSWCGRFLFGSMQLKAIGSGNRWLEGFAFLGLSLPGLRHFLSIGESSTQWLGFAGNVSLLQVFRILPWFAWCIVPAIALLVDQILRSRSKVEEVLPRSDVSSLFGKSPNSKKPSPPTPLPEDREKGAKFRFVLGQLKNVVMWRALVEGFGLLITTWLLTSFAIAPLMHQRYIIGAYAAFLVSGSLLMAIIRNRYCFSLGACISTAILGYSQGTFQEWRHERWIPWQRYESWRDAAEFLRRESSPEEPIFIAPMLIETAGERLDPALPLEYLVCPLATVYQVENARRLRPLPNDPSTWNKLVSDQFIRSAQQSGWLVVRSSTSPRIDDDGLRRGLDPAALIKLQFRHAYSTGRIQILRVEQAKRVPSENQ